jgi:hypothetical protein
MATNFFVSIMNEDYFEQCQVELRSMTEWIGNTKLTNRLFDFFYNDESMYNIVVREDIPFAEVVFEFGAKHRGALSWVLKNTVDDDVLWRFSKRVTKMLDDREAQESMSVKIGAFDLQESLMKTASLVLAKYTDVQQQVFGLILGTEKLSAEDIDLVIDRDPNIILSLLADDISPATAVQVVDGVIDENVARELSRGVSS